MNHSLLVLSQDAPSRFLAAHMLRARQIDALPCAADEVTPELLNCRGVIIADECGWPLDTGLPVLCLNGAAVQLCEALGGVALPREDRGLCDLSLRSGPLFTELSGEGCMLRRAQPLELPHPLEGIEYAGEACLGFRVKGREVYGVQYPIDRNDPAAGQLLWNFAVLICGAAEDFTEERMVTEICDTLADQARGEVLCTVSGGVDSSLCAVLAHRVLGNRVHCVLVDNGLLRKGERERIASLYSTQLKLPLEEIDCEERFIHALRGFQNAERKESAARRCMAEVLENYLDAHPQIETMVLGTNLNDLQYDAEALNGLKRRLRVVEPLRRLFKDEVRLAADEQELPPEIVSRQPFPASGLCCRVLGEVTVERLRLLRAADFCFRRQVEEGGHARKLYQYYATLCENPDQPETYAVCLRAVQATEMGGMAARLPFDVLESTSREILNDCPGVRRVVYDLSPSAHYTEEG